MIAEILTCALMFLVPAQDTLAEQPDKDAFWAKKKSLRIGYETHTFQDASAEAFPVRFGAGLTKNRNIWLHKQPIAGMMKFAFDCGLDVNYTMFDMNMSTDGYTGPQGWLGTSSPGEEYSEDSMPFDFSSVGMHNIAIGYAIGASLTVNPVAQLRVNGYFHFVPSASILLSGSAVNAGFMPYCKYGAELSYGWFGVGVEWGSGVSNMNDMVSKLMSMVEDADSAVEIPKTKYYSNYMKVYLAFRMGRNKRR